MLRRELYTLLQALVRRESETDEGSDLFKADVRRLDHEEVLPPHTVFGAEPVDYRVVHGLAESHAVDLVARLKGVYGGTGGDDCSSGYNTKSQGESGGMVSEWQESRLYVYE
jgi:hypothetical protein